MVEENVIKLRRAQLMIAKEIKRICDLNNINYFLDSGSMLGAVRHSGFIPWDDDMDIGMCCDDYEKFISIAPKELDNRFFLDNYETNKSNPLVFSKVRLKGTTYIENIGNNIFYKFNKFEDFLAFCTFLLTCFPTIIFPIILRREKLKDSKWHFWHRQLCRNLGIKYGKEKG